MKEITAIKEASERRGITRLCHFTPSRNLGHIATERHGVLASKQLEEDERAVFNPTDRDRFDGHPNHVCCSIQYPNAWYFKKARAGKPLFKDWVVLLIRCYYLWRPGTKFCPRNAAAGVGKYVQEGEQAFEGLFEKTVEGNRTFIRGPLHPAFLPTDQQAEVLIPDRVERRDVIGVAVYNAAQARREAVRMQMLHADPLPILIVPDFFEPQKLRDVLLSGRTPREREFRQGDDNGDTG